MLESLDLSVSSGNLAARVKGGTFEGSGSHTGWRAGKPVSSPGGKGSSTSEIMLVPDALPEGLGEKGTIALWLFRSSEKSGTGYNTVLSLRGDNSAILTAYIVWEGETAGTGGKALTYLHISGPAYVEGGAVPFGRRAIFDRAVRKGEWVHLAITWGPNGDQDNKIFLNGKEATAYARGGEPVPRSGNFGTYVRMSRQMAAGSSGDGADTFTEGLIGSVALYDTVETSFDLSKYRPTIRSLSDDTFSVRGISGKLVAGDRIHVSMEGDPGSTASFDFGPVKGVAMAEDPSKPGSYTNEYVVPSGIYAENQRIAGYLADNTGLQSEPFPSANSFTVDSRSSFALTIDKTDLPADSAATARVKVKVTDANGNPVKDHQVKVTLSTTDEYTGLVGGGSAKSSNTATAAKDLLAGADVETRWKGATDSWGEVEFDFKSGFAAKTIILQAKDLTSGDVGVDYITSYKEASIDIALTAPISRAAARRGVTYILKVEATKTELTADGRSRSVIRATLTDPNGKAVPGDPVTFALSSANGSLRTIQGTTDATGVATAEYTAGKKVGIVVVTATATLRNATGNVSITLLADAPAKIYLKARPESLPADGNSRADLSVKVTDINDNPNKDTKVEFKVSKGGGKIEYPDRLTDTFGDAANRYTAGNAAGIATILATVRSKVPTDSELTKARNVIFVPYYAESEDIRVSRWLKKVGDTVTKDEPVVEYTVGRSSEVRTLKAPYDCRIDFLYVEYWDSAKTGDTLAQITPVVIPGSTNPLPTQPALAPRRR